MSLLEEGQDQKSAKLCLLKELKKLTKENNHEGYHLDEKECANDIFNWKIGIFGPPNTLFEGGYFK
ncbi:MAG: Ubiquitin-conjugating enzyme E2 R2, partial [Paramarteilia canceri]